MHRLCAARTPTGPGRAGTKLKSGTGKLGLSSPSPRAFCAVAAVAVRCATSAASARGAARHAPVSAWHVLLAAAALPTQPVVGAGSGACGPPLRDTTIRQAVADWCKGGASKGGAAVKHGDIKCWSTAGVTDMSALFKNQGMFNDDINGWQTGSVTTMEDMFYYAGACNQRLNAWQTGRVILMEGMFVRAFAFNQNLNGWRTSSVTSMNEMFNYAQAFDQNINAWQTGMVADLAYVAASRLCRAHLAAA